MALRARPFELCVPALDLVGAETLPALRDRDRRERAEQGGRESRDA